MILTFEIKGETIDIRKYMGTFAMDVISSCAYGIKIDSINNPDHPVYVNAKKIFGLDITFSIILSVLAPKLARFLKLEFFDKTAIKFFDQLIQQIVAERKKLSQTSNEEKSLYFVSIFVCNQ